MNHHISGNNIVRAEYHQAELIAEILAEAFSDDPVATWINSETHLWLPSYYNILNTDFFLPRGQVYITKDGSGTALWLPPRKSMRNISPFKSLELLWNIISTSGASAMLRSMSAAVYLDIYHIKEPHYYLHVIGVKKRYAGQGIGTRLIREVLERCDREGVAAYLENSNIRNMDFYQRLGFRVLRKIRLLSRGPELWLMVRRPLLNKDRIQFL